MDGCRHVLKSKMDIKTGDVESSSVESMVVSV